MTELKPCEECGGDDLMLVQHRETDLWGIFCLECIEVFGYFKTEAEAIKAWNRRVE